jgi:hypothetical protein
MPQLIAGMGKCWFLEFSMPSVSEFAQFPIGRQLSPSLHRGPLLRSPQTTAPGAADLLALQLSQAKAGTCAGPKSSDFPVMPYTDSTQ